MKTSFLSGVKITAVPEDGDRFDYVIDYQECETEGPIVEISIGDESIVILRGVWNEVREHVDLLFEDDEQLIY